MQFDREVAFARELRERGLRLDPARYNPRMQRFTNQVRAEPIMGELRDLLTRIIAVPNLHARLVNTLSRMEYIGVRKMLKARHADLLDEEGLQHIIEEASHALRLKRAAIALNGGEEDGVQTYSEADTLAGPAGERYMQDIDRACEKLLLPYAFEDALRSDANYLLSTAAIEIRADAFYPVYEDCLQIAGAKFSVKSILKDELRHLAEIRESLERLLPGDWASLVARAVEAEGACFKGWLVAVNAQATEALEQAITGR
ncbi:MAG: hypothetical protein ACI8X5_002161 [Planctomycetota bacterium]